MQVSNDDFRNVIRRDAKRGEGRARIKTDRPPPRLCLVRAVASIDKDHLRTAPQQPHEIVHGVGRIVVIIKNEAIGADAFVSSSIFDGVDFPLGHDVTCV